jgi:prolyl-tRNA editing enzyme YbaK/EbsC (Cys-tRNA(Pro) deacylase)
MNNPVAAVRTALVERGVADTVTVLDDEVPTAVDAARVLDCDVAAIANSLVFDTGGSPLLILASGAARVDTKLVAAALGMDRIRRAGADFVLTHTGQAIGGVAPVGHPAQIRTVLDRSLAGHPVLWAGAGDHRAMFSIGFDDLRRITSAVVMDVRAD